MDIITGTSVIHRSTEDGRLTIIILCHPANGAPFQSHIPVRYPDQPALPGNPDWVAVPNQARTWLDCSPSVRISTTHKGIERELFHNGFNWQTPYREAAMGTTLDKAMKIHHLINEEGFSWDDAVKEAEVR